MVSCMGYLNCFPPRVAGVIFCFFIAVPFGGWWWYNEKCELVLCKMGGEMKMQNCVYAAKLRNGDGGKWCWWQLQLSRTRAVFFEEMTCCRRWSGNPNGQSKFCKYRAYLPILCLINRDWCSTADGNGSCHGLTLSFFEEMTLCQRQKHHWRWPGNPNGQSKFRKYPIPFRFYV